MKVVQSCALVILVLLVTVSANNGNDEIDFTEFAKGLSQESKAVFDSLDTKKKQLKYYDFKTKLQSVKDELVKLKQQKDSLEKQKGRLKKENIEYEDKQGYYEFTCAMDNIIGNTVLIYPQYKGEDEKDSYQNYLSFTYDSDPVIPKLIAQTVHAFTSVEQNLTITSQHAAIIKIPRFFCDMHAFLTRFDDYGHFLLAKSHGHAEAIIRKITESKLNGYQKEQAIIDFACRYARIRHGVTIFIYHFQSVISDKTKEISDKKRLAILSRTNTEPEESQISVTLPEVLDYIGFLTAWNFTIDDLTFMNLVSEIHHPSKGKIYFPYYYDVKDGNGKTLKGVLPFTDVINCPLTPSASTTTGSK